MDDLKKKYDDAVRERSDAFMKTVTISILEEGAEEYEELLKNAGELHLSDEYQEKKKKIIASLEKSDRKRLWKNRWKAAGKIAAVIALCLVTVCTVLTVSVDAFRYKVFEFLKIDHGEYLELVPIDSDYIREDERALFPDDWEGSFYPTSLPKGFALIETFDGGAIKKLTFGDGEDHFLNLTVSPAGETKTGVNNEDVKASEVEINGVKGDAWEDKDTCLIVWINYEHQFSLYSSTLTLDEMLKIAESVKYLKIK